MTISGLVLLRDWFIVEWIVNIINYEILHVYLKILHIFCLLFFKSLFHKFCEKLLIKFVKFIFRSYYVFQTIYLCILNIIDVDGKVGHYVNDTNGGEPMLGRVILNRVLQE